METNKSNRYSQKQDHDRESGEPGFVYTQYDRGANSDNKDGDNQNQQSDNGSDQQTYGTERY